MGSILTGKGRFLRVCFPELGSYLEEGSSLTVGGGKKVSKVWDLLLKLVFLVWVLVPVPVTSTDNSAPGSRQTHVCGLPPYPLSRIKSE